MTTPGAAPPGLPLTTQEEALLGRAARLVASEDPESFIDVSARVRSTVRATTRRSRPVRAVFPSAGGPAEDGDGSDHGRDRIDRIDREGIDRDDDDGGSRFPGSGDQGHGRGDVLVVREWVAVGGLREALATIPGVTPTRITLALDGDLCTGAAIHISATYGAVLADVASLVRRTVLDTLEVLLGSGAFDATTSPVDVTIDDVRG